MVVHARATALARCASPCPNEIFSPGNFVKGDQHVVRRHPRGRGNTRVDILQKCKSRLLRPSLDESDIQYDQIVGILHPDERRRVPKAVLRQLEDQLVKVFGRHPQRVHQGGLYGAGYLGDPSLVITAFDDMDFGERHDTFSLSLFSMQRFDRQRDTLTATDAKRDQAAGQTVPAHRMDQLRRQHCTGGADRMAMGDGAAFDVDDVLGQPELASDNDCDGREGFIDFDALDVGRCPSRRAARPA